MFVNKYVDILNNGICIEKVIGGILDDILFVADKFEDELDEKIFEKIRNVKGVSIEVVVRIIGDEENKESDIDNIILDKFVEENDMSIFVDF